MESIVEIYTLGILLGMGLLYGVYKLTQYAFWINQLWITIVLVMVFIIDSASIPFLYVLIYFGYALILMNIIGFVCFQKKVYSIE
ncbi:hypothetical protein [Formosa algae]|uniref:Uncharacterized protein n=1 Tax=Formosa algae TaxID=225843 RepID=A0A9X1C9U3_9FLAO|nr:hypothetical protein [Formosa algae]MBP1840963.1 hypothetical protein [Formosa algae]MDQ0336140.1 hypothetical protein [Formosa algae]